MAIATPIDEYLSRHRIDYHLLKHRPTQNLIDAARDATLNARSVARAVLLKDSDQRYLIAVTASNRKPDLIRIGQLIGKPVTYCETSLSDAPFTGCAPHVVPPFGDAFEIDTLWDQQLLEEPYVYVEDGDPTELIRLHQTQLQQLIDRIRSPTSRSRSPPTRKGNTIPRK